MIDAVLDLEHYVPSIVQYTVMIIMVTGKPICHYCPTIYFRPMFFEYLAIIVATKIMNGLRERYNKNIIQ